MKGDQGRADHHDLQPADASIKALSGCVSARAARKGVHHENPPTCCPSAPEPERSPAEHRSALTACRKTSLIDTTSSL